MATPLLPARFLFRFSTPCRHCEPLWTAEGAAFGETYRLPTLAELEERTTWADVWAAWNKAGLAFVIQVEGKRQPVWCRESRMEDSDGLRLWIDTRDVHNVHRAGRFCHQFLFLPGGSGAHLDQPVAAMLPIHRSREQPNPIRPGALQARCSFHKTGYRLDALVPAEALTGFDPDEHPRLGFNYALLDRELGEQTFGVGSPMPFHEDPSLWATLELVADSRASHAPKPRTL